MNLYHIDYVNGEGWHSRYVMHARSAAQARDLATRYIVGHFNDATGIRVNHVWRTTERQMHRNGFGCSYLALDMLATKNGEDFLLA